MAPSRLRRLRTCEPSALHSSANQTLCKALARASLTLIIMPNHICRAPRTRTLRCMHTESMVMTCGPKAYVFAFLVVVPLFSGLAGTSHRAEAQGSGPAAGAKRKLADAGPVLALVSLSQQRIWVYGSAGLIAE